MGRRASKPRVKKRKKVTVQLLKRQHAGEVVEPWRLMEEVIASDHGDLEEVKIALAWRIGLRADANGHLTLGQCRKRGDLDRELDSFDFVILLNKEAWPTLSVEQKRALIDHELCHAQVVMDSDGEPKRDDRGRLCCRIKKHDCEEFRAVVERHGLWTADLEGIAQAAINDAKRPLLAQVDVAETARANQAVSDAQNAVAGRIGPEAGGDTTDDGEDISPPAAGTVTNWRRLKLAALELSQPVADYLAAAGQRTLGGLSDYMAAKGEFWATDLKVGGQRKPPNFRAQIEDAWAEFWATHPEFVSTSGEMATG